MENVFVDLLLNKIVLLIGTKNFTMAKFNHVMCVCKQIHSPLQPENLKAQVSVS